MKAPVRYLNYSLHDNFSNKDLIKERCVFNLLPVMMDVIEVLFFVCYINQGIGYHLGKLQKKKPKKVLYKYGHRNDLKLRPSQL